MFDYSKGLLIGPHGLSLKLKIGPLAVNKLTVEEGGHRIWFARPTYYGSVVNCRARCPWRGQHAWQFMVVGAKPPLGLVRQQWVFAVGGDLFARLIGPRPEGATSTRGQSLIRAGQWTTRLVHLGPALPKAGLGQWLGRQGATKKARALALAFEASPVLGDYLTDIGCPNWGPTIIGAL